MSTPKKEDSNETSDPVFLNSGEVSQEVVEEKKEISLQDILNAVNVMNTKFDAKFDQVNSRLTGMEGRMAIQEARMSPPRSRAPSQEIFKEPKTEVSVVEVSGRSSLLEDFGSLEDSTSEDSSVEKVKPMKTPMPGQPCQ